MPSELQKLANWWPAFLVVLDVVLAVWVTLDAVLRKRDTRAVIAWVGLAWLAPFVGALSYYLFGINRLQRRCVALQVSEAWDGQRHAFPLSPEDVDSIVEFTNEYPQFLGQASVVRALADRPIRPGNLIRVLRDGDQAYPAMLEAINDARRSVALMSYIFDDDRAGRAFFDALCAAHARGVEVRVLIDGVGARYSKTSMISLLARAGIPAAAFLPTRSPALASYANLRNHRKILVVDGRVAFTGGTNIREGHWMSLEPDFPVSCLHFGFEGPVVLDLQEAFAIDWAFATGESLSGDLWFPVLERVGDAWCRGVPDGPDEDFDKMTYTLLGAVAAARQRLRIVTPYFLPDGGLAQALQVAAMRGVDVEIVLPSRVNIRLVEWAAEGGYEYLLEKGCRILLTPPHFDHTKLVVVDGAWCLVGSTNWDPRSLRLNFEFNVECYGVDLAKSLDELVDGKLAQARELDLEEVRSWGTGRRLRNGLARLFSPYL
jgi:cardiolipin synthase